VPCRGVPGRASAGGQAVPERVPQSDAAFLPQQIGCDYERLPQNNRLLGSAIAWLSAGYSGEYKNSLLCCPSHKEILGWGYAAAENDRFTMGRRSIGGRTSSKRFFSAESSSMSKFHRVSPEANWKCSGAAICRAKVAPANINVGAAKWTSKLYF
jgi:hypothetical protein